MCIPLHKRHLENTIYYQLIVVLNMSSCPHTHIVFYFIQMVANGIWQYSVQSRDWLLARAKTIGYIKPTLHDCMTVLFLTTLIVMGVGLHAPGGLWAVGIKWETRRLHRVKTYRQASNEAYGCSQAHRGIRRNRFAKQLCNLSYHRTLNKKIRYVASIFLKYYIKITNPKKWIDFLDLCLILSK